MNDVVLVDDNINMSENKLERRRVVILKKKEVENKYRAKTKFSIPSSEVRYEETEVITENSEIDLVI